MIRIRASRPDESAHAVEIWRAAVDATHHFLLREDRIAIDADVCAFLPQLPLILAVDEQDRALAFMAVSGTSMDALFVHPEHHRRGIGRALVKHALDRQPFLTTAVNEQNGQAMRFYEGLGFVRTGRQELDEQGRRYPLITLRLEPEHARVQRPAGDNAP